MTIQFVKKQKEKKRIEDEKKEVIEKKE